MATAEVLQPGKWPHDSFGSGPTDYSNSAALAQDISSSSSSSEMVEMWVDDQKSYQSSPETLTPPQSPPEMLTPPQNPPETLTPPQNPPEMLTPPQSPPHTPPPQGSPQAPPLPQSAPQTQTPPQYAPRTQTPPQYAPRTLTPHQCDTRTLTPPMIDYRQVQSESDSTTTEKDCPSYCTGVTEYMMNRNNKRRLPSECLGESDQDSGYLPLPPEVEEGKFEYKLKLIAPSSTRFEHLVTQMKWRLQEGAGEAIYEIGVEDCGTYIGLKENELKASMNTLKSMAERLGASLTNLRKTELDDGRSAVEVLVRKVPEDQQFLDLRIAVLGNVDCGKSTLVGVLAHGELDNGRGKARLNLFRHRHEIQSGRTSSISQEIIGFNSEGELKNFAENTTAEDICESSSKIIQFIDVPGHQKYLKTTIFGLMGHSPHFAMLVMSANTGIIGTTREQLGFALCLQVPIFVVVTKVDCCRQAVLEKNLLQMERLLKSPGTNKTPMRIVNESDAVDAATKMNSDSVVPVFKVSNKTGAGMDLLKKFLNVLPPTASSNELDKLAAEQHLSFQIDDVFTDVPDVGLVISGTVKKGCVKEDDVLLASPLENGSSVRVKVTSVHRNRFPCRMVKAGQAAALALTSVDGSALPPMRKGMILTSLTSKPPVCSEFEAEINLLFHQKSIKRGFQCTVHIGSVCQTAEILTMSEEKLRTNGKATVRFKFLKKQPECVYPGSKLLFRQGTTRGLGVVTKVMPYDETNTSRYHSAHHMTYIHRVTSVSELQPFINA